MHWINTTNMKREKSVLACRRLIGPLTCDILSRAMERVLKEFRIENKVVRTTTDNGNNFLDAFRYDKLLLCVNYTSTFM